MAPDRNRRLAPEYPVNLRLIGRKCLVVGGGPVAERKVATLLEAGVEVVLVSPVATQRLADWSAAGRLTHQVKSFDEADAAGCFIVICATDSSAVNEKAAIAARKAGALVNVVDAPELCDFTLPAKLSRGSLSITVSTGGQSPALARELRNELKGQYGPEYGEYLDIVGRIRDEWKQACASSSERCERWQEIGGFDGEALELFRQGCPKEAEVRIRNVIGCLGTQS